MLGALSGGQSLNLYQVEDLMTKGLAPLPAEGARACPSPTQGIIGFVVSVWRYEHEG